MNDQPYRGNSWVPINLLEAHNELTERNARLREYGIEFNGVDEILAQFGSWAVTTYGIEHLGQGNYALKRRDVHSDTLPAHMAEKRWVDVHAFLLALEDARRRWPLATPRLAAASSSPTVRRISQRKRFTILQRDGFSCQLCGRTAEHDHVKLHVDHQQPVSKGGDDSDENLWTLCSDCNLGKSDQT